MFYNKPAGYPKISNIEKIAFQLKTGVPYRRNGGAPVTRKWRNESNWFKPVRRK